MPRQLLQIHTLIKDFSDSRGGDAQRQRHDPEQEAQEQAQRGDLDDPGAGQAECEADGTSVTVETAGGSAAITDGLTAGNGGDADPDGQPDRHIAGLCKIARLGWPPRACQRTLV